MKDFNISLFMLIVNLFVVVIIFLSQVMSAAITRKTLLFGNRVPEGIKKEKEARRITSLFVFLNAINAVLFAGVAFAAYRFIPQYSITSTICMPFLIMLPTVVIYYISWKRSKKLKEAKGWKGEYTVFVDTSISSETGRGARASSGWYIMSVLALIISAAVSVYYLPYAPEMLPIHWGIDGPDQFTENSIWVILPIFLIGLGVVALMYASSFVVSRSRLQRGGVLGGNSIRQGVKYKKMTQKCLGYLSFLISLIFVLVMLMCVTIIPSPTTSAPMMLATVIFLLVSIVPLFVVLIKAGQGGEKLNIEGNEVKREIKTVSADEDHLWKMGLFYYNPDDPSLFLENRFGSGWDFNYARPAAWVIVISTALLVAGALGFVAFAEITELLPK